MNRVQELLDANQAVLKSAVLNGRPLFEDVRVQLDPYDLDDVVRESFQAPAARVLLTSAKPEPRLDGAMDLECTVTYAVISKRTSLSGADADALDRALVVAQLVNDNPYFGLQKLKAATQAGMRVAVSEASTNKGLSIVLVMVKTCLLEVVRARDLIGNMMGTREGAPVKALVANGAQVDPAPEDAP